jgi:site-specific recombinase
LHTAEYRRRSWECLGLIIPKKVYNTGTPWEKEPASMLVSQASQTRDLVLSSFPARDRDNPDVQSLASLLENFLAAPDLAARLDGFVELKAWSTSGHRWRPDRRLDRLEALLSLVESQAEIRSGFQQTIGQILVEMHSVESFAEAGLHPREGLWSDAARRLTQRILPSARDDSDLSRLVFRLYPTAKSIDRLIEQTDTNFERIARLLSPVENTSAWIRQRDDLRQAFLLLGVHVAGLGLSPGLRARSHAFHIEDSPFFLLHQSSVELVRQNGASLALDSWRIHVQGVRRELQCIHVRMEDAGVSTALIFDIRTIEHALIRMEWITEVLFVAEPHEHIRAVKRLVDDVMNSTRDDLSLIALFRDNTALLARKVVERTGKTGEHYIANTRKEYRSIWWASLGGGLLTVLTAAVKMRIVEAPLPPFLEGMVAGTNYAASFILLQHLHLALATKQPSVTAATFAGIVRTTHGQERLDKLTDLISRICRSQLASAAGNLIAVCLGCVAFAKLWALVVSRPYLEIHSAEHVYQTLDPLGSGTAIYATITGVILWVSALAGGWFENFSTFNRIPAAIAQHPLGRRIGQDRMKRLAEFVDRNISGWITCIVLGYLLGFTPAVGGFFGIPLDVRHVTLSTGTLALAAASFGQDWLHSGWFVRTLYGIAITFVLNLGVSFSIAASVAMQAYEVPRADRLQAIGYTLKSFFKSPRRFLFPPRNDPAPDTASTHGSDAE